MNTLLRPLAVILLLSGVGCKTEENTPSPVATTLEPVCAVPSGDAELHAGDANHDGLSDVSDGVMTLRYVLNGGAEPACVDAQDLLREGTLDVGDALVLLYQYTLPLDFPRDGKLECDSTVAIAEAACGVFDLSFDAPASVAAAPAATATAQVGVMLTSSELEVQAWTLGVKAEGCTISGSSESGSVIADVRLDPVGQRDDGFSRADVVEGGLTHVGLLSWKTDVTLAPSPTARRLLTLDVQATAPGSGCTPCTLSYTDSLVGAGRTVGLVVTSGGRTYVPSTQEVSVDICSG